MKNIYTLFFCLCFLFVVQGQDSIRQRIILIGDAGEIDIQQQGVLTEAARYTLSSKTTVLFLGDNVYPRGMGLPGSAEEESTKKILQAQYTPFRAKGASVYFIPGNHDWDRMGKLGLQKIKQQWKYLDEQEDSLLKMIPANGCPDPFEINFADSLTIIAFDSEWWLFQHSKENNEAQCSCNTKQEVVDALQKLMYKNRYKIVILAAHHPFQSYGHHGGYFSLKDHLFPLTAINKNLYIPLPVIGSLYPLLRSTFISPEDMAHPLYKDMIKQVDESFDRLPNLIHAAGHEHGLQFIKDKQVQIVSGSGAKEAFVKKGKHALFAQTAPGFVTADLLTNNDMRFTYYLVKNNVAASAFTYTQPYTDVKALEEKTYTDFTRADSVFVKANAGYDSVSNFHRTLFGENYRKEWSSETKLPVIKISEIKGGLIPVQRGGGHQSYSLRLKDKTGKEWVLRSVNKYPAILLPEQLRETFAKDILTDAMSAQHPYGALVVPIIANAAGVLHASPVIGLVAPDKAFGLYEKDFVNTVCLLEEREPAGKSDNSEKMYKELTKDNDNSIDSALFLRARLLDLFIGDWDRHEDQWRWLPEKHGKGKKYLAVPRDRDQVFHINEGIVPKMASRPWIAPLLHDFDGKIKQVNAFFTESNTLNKRFLNQFGYDEWMSITNEFVAAMTDSVLEAALRQLPEKSYRLRHDKLLAQLKERRENMAPAMDKYYHFLNRVTDIQTSNKNEFVSITDAPGSGLQVSIYKINKEGEIKDQLYKRIFDAGVTKEIRLYVDKGDDSVSINNHSPIKLRIIGGKGSKVYNALATEKTIQVYDKENNAVFMGNDESKFSKHLSNDSLNTAYIPSNPYNKTIPLLSVGYNLDDGVMLGAAVKFINQGFRKKPYSSMQNLSFQHSFSTNAFRFRYHGEWLQVLHKTNFTINAKALAPTNTQNFFGLGNETEFDKTGNYKKYYRARFQLYQLDPAFYWQKQKSLYFSIGPSVQYYRFEAEDNLGRFILNPSLLHTYDSSTIEKSKLFAGLIINLVYDKRNNPLLPTEGGYLGLKAQAYTGLNSYSKAFAQLIPEFAFYKTVDKQSAIVIADRVGGGISTGKTTFYQSLFLGGQENLLGYRQYRFAGEHMLYNNFEVRIRIASLANYILPGQLGLTGFYDVGRVWADNYNSNTWHQGVGGGIYFAPAQLAVFQFVMGYSREGWYPYFTMGLRF